MNGYPESYVIDLDSFKYRHEYKYIVGVYEDMLTVGDMYYSDVIGKTLQTIDTALDTKYWHWMGDYVAQNICAAGSNAHLGTWQTNIIQALKAYPSYKKAVLPAGKCKLYYFIYGLIFSPIVSNGDPMLFDSLACLPQCISGILASNSR